MASNGVIHMIDGLLYPPSILPILPHRCDVIESKITVVSRERQSPAVKLENSFQPALLGSWSLPFRFMGKMSVSEGEKFTVVLTQLFDLFKYNMLILIVHGILLDSEDTLKIASVSMKVHKLSHSITIHFFSLCVCVFSGSVCSLRLPL